MSRARVWVLTTTSMPVLWTGPSGYRRLPDGAQLGGEWER
jgi:hypothetical protein